ncbi:MAG: NADH-quinone oxidoreductase subunit J [Candidatus Eremiobacteraeota bacterium]|nr:NADH-quinone oxidoreductase subunit J [Candidatus Eremiobacteraeota bacterium]
MIGFAFLAVVLIATAVWVVTAKKPVYSVIGLLAHFAALAAMYITLSAEFLGVVQIIVYSGAILVLFVFVIALLSSGVDPFSSGPNRMPKAAIPAGLLVLGLLGLTAYAVRNVTTVAPRPSAAALAAQAGDANTFGSVADFGKALFTVHLLPFEITAFVLMVAVIGVILLAGDKAALSGSPAQAAKARREMREAVVRAGDE